MRKEGRLIQQGLSLVIFLSGIRGTFDFCLELSIELVYAIIDLGLILGQSFLKCKELSLDPLQLKFLLFQGGFGRSRMMMVLFGIIIHGLLMILEPTEHFLGLGLVSLDLILENLELDPIIMQIIQKLLLDRSDHIWQMFLLDLRSHLIDYHLDINHLRLDGVANLELQVLSFLFIKIFIVLLAHDVRPCHRVQVFKTASARVVEQLVLAGCSLVEGVLREEG